MSEPTGPPSFRLADLQAHLRTVLEGCEHPPLGTVAALTEECGEVASKLLEHHVYGAKLDRKGLGEELTDVLVCLFEIATLHGIDFENAAHAKLIDIESKAPEWRVMMRKAREGESA